MRWPMILFVLACDRDPRPPQPTARVAPTDDAALHVDVPRLSNASGTFELEHLPIVEVRTSTSLPARIAAPTLVAADRGQTAGPLLDSLWQRGVSVPRFLVLVGSERREIEVAAPSATSSAETVAIHALHISESTVDVDHAAVGLAELRSKLAGGNIELMLDPDVTLQRLAEVTAALGGRLHPVPAPNVEPMPSVEPMPR